MKYIVVDVRRFFRASLPARGAWIEIGLLCAILTVIMVAPRKGSVD